MKMTRYANTQATYILVFRYGLAFRVMLKKFSKTISFEALKITCEDILASTPVGMSWVSVLTADDRDRWAKVR